MKSLWLFSLLTVSSLLNAAETASSLPAKATCCTTNASDPGRFSDTSLYQLDSTWTSATERKLRMGEFKGQVQVVTMFFARCEFACPILIHDMKRIEAALPTTLRTNVGFLLVSFDTERDTPEALRAYSQRVELDTSRWTLLRGSQDDVLEFAALLGIKFKKDSRGQFAHSNVITVLNSAGEIVFQQIGLNQDIQPTLKTISTAACEPERP
jgi:protein SCO1/2